MLLSHFQLFWSLCHYLKLSLKRFYLFLLLSQFILENKNQLLFGFHFVKILIIISLQDLNFVLHVDDLLYMQFPLPIKLFLEHFTHNFNPLIIFSLTLKQLFPNHKGIMRLILLILPIFEGRITLHKAYIIFLEGGFLPFGLASSGVLLGSWMLRVWGYLLFPW